MTVLSLAQLALAVGLVAPLCGPAQAAEEELAPLPPAKPGRFRKVERWAGVVRMNITYRYRMGSSGNNDQFHKSVSGRLTLDRRVKTETLKGEDAQDAIGATVWEGKASYRATIGTRSETYGVPGLASTTVGSGAGDSERDIKLSVNGDQGTYGAGLPAAWADTDYTSYWHLGGNLPPVTHRRQRDPVELFPPFNAKSKGVEVLRASGKVRGSKLPAFAGELPDSGYVLQGHLCASQRPSSGKDQTETRYEASWTLWPEQMADVAVVVDIDEYRTWVPQGSIKTPGLPGNSLTVKAALETKAGKPSTLRAEKFAFELLSVSEEPGVCLNYPPKQSGPSPPNQDDLQFLAERNPNGSVDGDNTRRLTVKPSGGSKASAVLSSLDYGAYGVLQVSAFVEGHGEVVGYLRGDPACVDIEVPKRVQGSDIAEDWLKAKAPKQTSDDLDDEDAGGGLHPGDGLSVYEEYRGFVVIGSDGRAKHLRASPKRLTLFVHSTVGRVNGGLRMFERATGVQVLRVDEAGYVNSLVRLVNFNKGTHNLLDQHGLWIVSAAVPAGAGADSPYGPPQYVSRIRLRPDNEKWRGLYRDSTIAHEMGHAVGVPHHGDGAAWWAFGNGMVATRDEDMTWFVAKPQGEHSGAQDCFMRYHWADWIERERGRPRSLVEYGPAEPDGTVMCVGREGTGVNAPGRTPYPKCGDAAPGHGVCQTLITISDKHPKAKW